MWRVPAIGECTICELNRDFLVSKGDADTEAQNTYSKILGRVYPAIPFRLRWTVKGFGVLLPHAEEVDGREDAVLDANGIPSTSKSRDTFQGNVQSGFLTKQFLAIKNAVFRSIQTIFPGPNLELLRKLELSQGVSWHKHKQFLAFVSGVDQVTVYDFEDPESRDPFMLSSESQRSVAAVEWRPNSGATLSVACRGGICIWTASYPGSVAPIRSGVASFLSTSRGTGVRWALVDFLQNHGCPVTALSWNPLGRLLASASWDNSEFTIWDVSQGNGTPLRRGFGGISYLKWSPKADYLLSATTNGSFHIWETDIWTSERWSSAGGSVVSASWNPEGSILLIAFDRVTTLGALYFTGKPPCLDVHLLPIELPEIDSITGGNGMIEKMAWDGTGERLAVSFSGGDETFGGLVAIYDTRKVPILSVSLLGFVRGPGYGAKPLAFSFYDRLTQGVLLAVCWSTGVCSIYPLLFR
eukprot:c13686_g1_i1 orf=43-1449(+)